MECEHPNLKDFMLWLEFEHVNLEPWNPANDFCNMEVTLKDGRRYGFNVWTYAYIETARTEANQKAGELNGAFLMPPDLLVDVLTRSRLEEVVAHLLHTTGLPSHLQTPEENK